MKHFLLSLGLLLCCVTASVAQDKNPDVPLGDPAYADLTLLTSIVWADEDWRGRPMTRYEFAVATARLLRYVDSFEEADRARRIGPSTPSNHTSSQGEILLFAALKRLVEKFRPELKALGVQVEQIKINGVYLIEPQRGQPELPVAPSFADVPKNHWAYEAVETLRLSGIMIGIPSGGTTHFNSPLER